MLPPVIVQGILGDSEDDDDDDIRPQDILKLASSGVIGPLLASKTPGHNETVYGWEDIAPPIRIRSSSTAMSLLRDSIEV